MKKAALFLTDFRTFLLSLAAVAAMFPQFRAAASDIVQAGDDVAPVRESVQQQVQQTQMMMQMMQIMQQQQTQMQKQMHDYHAEPTPEPE